MTTTRTLTFEIDKKKILNSNNMPNAWIVKSQIASFLRETGGEIGVKNHPNKTNARKRFNAIRSEEERKTKKARQRKKMNKEKSSEEDINTAMEKIDAEYCDDTSSSDITVDYIFDKFNVDVKVFTPSKRRFDPPNFYPTIKHIIDGLTDASWWEDDSFDKLTRMSFQTGGKTSGIKDTFVFVLDITSVE